MSPEAIRAHRAESAADQPDDVQPSIDDEFELAPDDEPTTARDLPLDVIFELLQNQRRRRVLRYLEDVSGSVDLGTLAEALAAEENDKTVQELNSSERKRVYICLYQCHLPKLDDAGVIEFESNRGTIERTELTIQLTEYLDRVIESDTPNVESETAARWPARYFGISCFGGGLYVLQAAMFPSLALSNILMAGVIGLLFVISLLHTYTA